MLRKQHRDVRTTLTLENDVAAQLRAEARRTGRPFKKISSTSVFVARLHSATARIRQRV